MKDAHERARLDEQFVKRACEYLAKPAGTFRELKQMEIFA